MPQGKRPAPHIATEAQVQNFYEAMLAFKAEPNSYNAELGALTSAMRMTATDGKIHMPANNKYFENTAVPYKLGMNGSVVTPGEAVNNLMEFWRTQDQAIAQEKAQEEVVARPRYPTAPHPNHALGNAPKPTCPGSNVHVSGSVTVVGSGASVRIGNQVYGQGTNNVVGCVR